MIDNIAKSLTQRNNIYMLERIYQWDNTYLDQIYNCVTQNRLYDDECGCTQFELVRYHANTNKNVSITCTLSFSFS